MKRHLPILLLSTFLFLCSCATGQVFLEKEKPANPVNPNSIHSDFTYAVEPYHKIWGTILWIAIVLIALIWTWWEFKTDPEVSDEDKSK